MPIQSDSNGRRFIAVEAEVPGNPEDVWQAIATGAGITAWFVPSRIDERVGGEAVLDFGPGMEAKGVIQEWDPPRRMVVENKEAMGPGSPTVADEWTVEAKAGGTCRVRVVHSWFASTDEWDGQYKGVETGWPAFFRVLRQYLLHFRGQACTQVPLMTMSALPREAAWTHLTEAFGFAPAIVGQPLASTGDAPRLEAIVEHEALTPHSELVLRLQQPAPGLAHLMVMSMGKQAYVSVRLFLYGAGAPAAAARLEPEWHAWLDRVFPAGA